MGLFYTILLFAWVIMFIAWITAQRTIKILKNRRR